MPAIPTLQERVDFLRLNRGRKFMSAGFILRYAATGDADPSAIRVGYTVTTKCGNAVIRNRIKRRLRALVAAIGPEFAKPGTDYVFIARADASPSLAEIDHAQLKADMRRAFNASRQ